MWLFFWLIITGDADAATKIDWVQAKSEPVQESYLRSGGHWFYWDGGQRAALEKRAELEVAMRFAQSGEHFLALGKHEGRPIAAIYRGQRCERVQPLAAFAEFGALDLYGDSVLMGSFISLEEAQFFRSDGKGEIAAKLNLEFPRLQRAYTRNRIYSYLHKDIWYVFVPQSRELLQLEPKTLKLLSRKTLAIPDELANFDIHLWGNLEDLKSGRHDEAATLAEQERGTWLKAEALALVRVGENPALWFNGMRLKGYLRPSDPKQDGTVDFELVASLVLFDGTDMVDFRQVEGRVWGYFEPENWAVKHGTYRREPVTVPPAKEE